ncbi:MAG: hypothetical protein JKY56_05295 [Kofleriaceae bacterium]|nr:hypothetical protein [Kofleriaceae bacterium]
MSIRAFLTSIAVSIALGASLFSCGGSTKDSPPAKNSTTIQSDETSGPERLPDQTLPSEFSQQSPTFSNSEALQYLPDTVSLLLLGKSPLEIARTLETSTILRDYPNLVRPLKELGLASGASMPFPETWEKVGIAADKQAGVAIEFDKGAFVMYLFATIGDAELVRETLRSLPSRSPTQLGELGSGHYTATWKEATDVSVEVRGNALFFILDEAHIHTKGATRTVTSANNAATLIRREGANSFDFGQNLSGLVFFPQLSAAVAHDVSDYQSDDTRLEELDRKIDVAIAEARDADVIRLKEQLQEELKWQKRRQLAQAGEELAIRRYLAPLALAPFGIELDGATTRMRAQLTPKPGSHFSKLFTANTTALALPGRLQASPLFMVSGHFNPNTVLSMIEPILFFESITLKQLKSDVAKYSGTSFESVISLFDGELSGALTIDLAETNTSMEEILGIHILVHLRDPAAMQRIVDTLSKRAELAQFTQIVDGRVVLDMPNPFNKAPSVRLQVVGDYLELRSHRGNDKGAQLFNVKEQTLMAQTANRAIMIVDPVLLFFMMMAGSMDMSIDGSGDLSKAEKEKLANLQVKQENAQKEYHTALLGHLSRTSNAFGRLVVTAQNQEKGYAVLAGLFGSSANLGRSVQMLIEAAEPEFKQDRTGKTPKILELKKRLRAIENEIMDVKYNRPF